MGSGAACDAGDMAGDCHVRGAFGSICPAPQCFGAGCGHDGRPGPCIGLRSHGIFWDGWYRACIFRHAHHRSVQQLLQSSSVGIHLVRGGPVADDLTARDGGI